jgi:Salmonella virulence plasmid 65kDa B protein/Insecticide toxin TcdB middle/N-terminal region/FG-GAP-like repeat
MIQANWTRRPSAPRSSARGTRLHRRVISLSVITSVLLAATTSLQAQTPTIVAGTSVGQFGVSSGGSASYTIPIPVPPGVAGMQPQLALSYNSQGGSGLVGMGWNLGGLSSITRCPRTKGQDGVRGSVNFDDNDRYCLDGQRLILSSGTYGQANAEYRTEMEGFSKIVSLARAGNGAASFKVWTKGGQIMEYGNTADSRIEAVPATGTTPTWPNTTARVWALNKITDVKGNYLTVSYDEDTTNGVYRPARIDYAGNAMAGTPTHSSVRFTYQDLPNPVAKYQAGAVMKLVSTLTEVAVYHGDTTVVSRTKLTYQNIGATQTPRLSSVQQCDGATSCLTPLNLTYAAETSGFSTTATPWALPTAGMHYQRESATDSNGNMGSVVDMVDVNGDGLVDLLDQYNGKAYLNTGSGFSTTPLSRSTCGAGFGGGGVLAAGGTNRGAVDLNGDGLVDTYYTDGGVNPDAVLLNVCNSAGVPYAYKAWPMPRLWGLSPWAPPVYQEVGGTGNSAINGFSTSTKTNSLVDLDGDGLPDAYQGTEVYLNNGAGFSSTGKPWPLPSGVWALGHTDTSGGTQWSPAASSTKFSLIDLNGDGLPDMYVTTGSSPGVVYLNTGIGFSTTATPWPIPPIADPETPRVQNYSFGGITKVGLVDLNGDGLPDLYLSGAVHFNTGNGFSTTATSWTSPGGYQSISGNGKTTVGLVDLNGDGLVDQYVTEYGVPDESGFPRKRVYFNQTTPPHLLVQVSSATGPTTSISYARLTDSTVYTKDSGANAAVFPQVDLARAASVVSSVASSNGVGGTNTTSYSYGGLKTEAGTGRGMLGFRWVKSKDLSTGLERYTEYRQDFPYTGIAAKSETRLAGSGNGGVLKRTTTTPACNIPQTGVACTVAPDKTYFPFVASQLEEAWDLNGSAYPSSTSTVTYSTFPHYGGPTQTSISSTEGWSKTTANEYLAPDTNNWIVGRVKKTTVTSVKP